MSAEESKDVERKEKVQIKITEDALNENTKKIPKVIFIENVEAWVDKYSDDELFNQMNELY